MGQAFKDWGQRVAAEYAQIPPGEWHKFREAIRDYNEQGGDKKVLAAHSKLLGDHFHKHQSALSLRSVTGESGSQALPLYADTPLGGYGELLNVPLGGDHTFPLLSTSINRGAQEELAARQAKFSRGKSRDILCEFRLPPDVDMSAIPVQLPDRRTVSHFPLKVMQEVIQVQIVVR